MGVNHIENSHSLNIFMGQQDRTAQARHGENKEQEGQVKGGTVFAGNLNLPVDRLSLRKEMARQEAMKALTDQFTSDLKIDNVIQESKDNISSLSEDILTYRDEVTKIDDMRETLKNEYEITDDSTEQKDLELLQKNAQDPLSLTDAQRQQVEEMGPLTDYQKTSLEYDSMEQVWQQKIQDAEAGVLGNSRNIASIEQELNKVHPMVDAQLESDKILDAASKEAYDMLLAEGKEKIDEKQEEAEKEIQEKKEEEADEAKKEAAKEADAQNAEALSQPAAASSGEQSSSYEEVSNEIVLGQTGDTTKLGKELKQILDKNMLLEEDLKGIMIDTVL